MRIDPAIWLNASVPGFSNLSPKELHSILHFPLLWSYLEAAEFSRSASSAVIHSWVVDRVANGKAKHDLQYDNIAYFRNRYSQNGAFTPLFESLNLRNNDLPELVGRVILSEVLDPVSELTTLFVIIYRLRNNLLHGEKWAYELRDQSENFEHACDAIIIELS